MILTKAEARTLALAKRAALSAEEREAKSRRIRENVLALPEYQAAKTVMLFLNFRDEVATTELAVLTLGLGKTLVLPRCSPQGVLILGIVHDLEKDIAPGKWGIREPKMEELREADPRLIDLVLVPGAAFDLQGRRLGYGAGYYDRFFLRLRPAVPLAALAFACQVLPEVPVESHDQKMTLLITEEGVYRF